MGCKAETDNASSALGWKAETVKAHLCIESAGNHSENLLINICLVPCAFLHTPNTRIIIIISKDLVSLVIMHTIRKQIYINIYLY